MHGWALGMASCRWAWPSLGTLNSELCQYKIAHSVRRSFWVGLLALIHSTEARRSNVHRTGWIKRKRQWRLFLIIYINSSGVIVMWPSNRDTYDPSILSYTLLFLFRSTSHYRTGAADNVFLRKCITEYPFLVCYLPRFVFKNRWDRLA